MAMLILSFQNFMMKQMVKKYKKVDIQIVDKSGNTSDTNIQYEPTLPKLGFDGLTNVKFFEQVSASEANFYTYYIKDNISDISISETVDRNGIFIGDDNMMGMSSAEIAGEISSMLFGSNAAFGV